MKVRRVDFSPDEWLAGTVGLDNATRGLYITACALIYSHGGPIPEGELRRACCDHGLAYKRQLACLISAGKLTENDGRIAQERCENELRKARERSENGRKNVAERWKNNTVKAVSVLVLGNANHQPSTTREKKEPNGSSFSPLPIDPNGSISLDAGAPRLLKSDFDQFWQAYPLKVAKEGARRKYEIARRLASADDILAGAKRYAAAVAGKDREFIKHPDSWLHNGRWQDEEEPSAPMHRVPDEPPPLEQWKDC